MSDVTPRVSVAMCTYNGAAFIQSQLDSIAEQTVLPDEIIVCDDGSSDTTLKHLETFKTCYPHKVVIHRNLKNMGSIRNFEQAIGMCTGDIILLSDQDDIWYPDRVERSVAALMADDTLAYIFSDADLIDERGDSLASKLWEAVKFTPNRQERFNRGDDQSVMLFRWAFVTGATMAFKSGIKEHLIPEPDLAFCQFEHDRWIAYILSLKKLTGRAVMKSLIRYRIHEHQQTGVKMQRGFFVGTGRFLLKLYNKPSVYIKKRKIRNFIKFNYSI